MARALRIEYEGAAYHVMARGDQGEPIFADDRDRDIWVNTLGEACEKTGWHIHAYVLMSNHYHLLLETPEGNLVAGMKWLQGTYTQRYNGRHSVFGHLFQGRYKALVVDGQAGNYFDVVSTYIHLNPARAGLAGIGKQELASYFWSSYPWYVRMRRGKPGWLITERVLGNLGLESRDAKGYEAYLEGRVLELGIKEGRKALEKQWQRIRRGWYLGGDGFRGRMLKELKTKMTRGRQASYTGLAKLAHGQREAERMAARGLEALGVAQEELAQMPKGAKEKQVLAWWLRQSTTASRRWISERLAMGDETRVSQAVRRGQREVKWKHLRERLLESRDSEEGHEERI
jgi:putative transposase